LSFAPMLETVKKKREGGGKNLDLPGGEEEGMETFRGGCYLLSSTLGWTRGEEHRRGEKKKGGKMTVNQMIL